MSTAGKVLVVLVMLTAIVCLILAGGVAQLNRNGNQRSRSWPTIWRRRRRTSQTAKREIIAAPRPDHS